MAIQEREKKVLIVDRDNWFLSACQKSLDFLGVASVVKSNLEEARTALNENKFTHIISDRYTQELATKAKKSGIKACLVSYNEEEAKELGVKWVNRASVNLATLTDTIIPG